MRKWLALLMGTAALALAGTAFALSGEYGDGEKASPDTTAETKELEGAVDEVVLKEPVEEVELPKIAPGDYELPDEKIEREPLDMVAPEIVILHPEDGQVFERKEVVFEGETEPGAHVYARDREADVSDGGAWRLVLVLSPGENEVTVFAKDEAGNVGSDTVTVVYKAPKEEPKPDKPKEEKSKEEKPKEEKPKEEPAEWEFVAYQVFGECSENPPYDVFHGKGKPGTLIHIESEYGGGTAEVGEKGGWEIKVFFEGAPIGQVFAVHVTDQFEHHKVFEFVHTD
jgi:hypothetical protein